MKINFRKVQLSITSLIMILLTGCAFAPFATTPTARTTGAGQHLMQASLVEAEIPSFRYEYGLLPTIDVGAEGEFGFGSYVLGLYSKVGFGAGDQGLSTAAILGLGKNVFGEGEYWYAGPIVSYKFTFFEPAILLRYTDTRVDDVDFYQASGDITFDGDHFRYWYLVLSATVYPADWFGIIFQVADALSVNGGGGNFIDGMVFNVGINYKL
jgi:hypothetical protein